MELWTQIARGTLFLSISAGIHLALIIFSLPWLTRVAQATKEQFRAHRAGLLISLAFGLTVFGHTVQVWIWAGAFLWYGAIDGVDTAVYFSLSTYTTLGYGDIILDDTMRTFGAFASVCGMLTFGISTAFLVGMIGRVLPKGLH
ncbi:ion channel [Sulfitobacter sp. MF3-043]|uniref:ion channel n=1 Tax=Sulfitobacter sediminivivens TaxID=3252902 RepID=UPI0036DF1AEC